MPLDRPTLQALRTRVASDVATRFGRTSLLRRSVLQVLSDAVAGASHSLHGRLEWIFRQTFPDTAEGESLDRMGLNRGVPRRPASLAVGEVTITGTIGSTVPTGAELRGPDGQSYRIVPGVTLADVTATVQVEAVSPGSAGNLEEGVDLLLAQSFAGISQSAVVAAGGIGGGSDPESDASLRQRILQDMRNPGQGGNAGDYVRWALEVPGVTRAWVYPNLNGLGTVGVAVMRDGDSDPYPDGAALALVQEHIDDLRPVAMVGVQVFAPTPKPVEFRIHVEPDTPEIRSDILAALRSLFNAEGASGPYQASSSIPISRISEAISSASGERSHQLIEPATAPVVEPRELLTVGDVSWV